MVRSQSAHGAREKRPVVLELGQLEGRLQSPRLTGAGEPTVGRARARARALSTQHKRDSSILTRVITHLIKI